MKYKKNLKNKKLNQQANNGSFSKCTMVLTLQKAILILCSV